MYWILATVCIIVALTIPRLRPLGVAGCIILGTLLAWGMVQRLRGPAQNPPIEQRGRPSSPAATLHSIPLSMVVVDNLTLSGAGAPFELRVRIVNNTKDTVLRSVTVRLTRRDCYPGALDPSGCAKVWQDDHWIATSVLPGQSREFVEVIWMHGEAPRPRGKPQDTFELIAAAGEGGIDVERPQQ